jgi:flagellar hook assembly protein FlgD
MNVATGERATITIDFAQAGRASVVIIDRDGYLVRTLANAQPAHGAVAFHWDGRDDRGQLVADEAYSLKVDWRGSKVTDT